MGNKEKQFNQMEELLPKLIPHFFGNGKELIKKVDSIKERLGIGYVDVLWKALSVLDENCDLPLDGPDYNNEKLFCEHVKKKLL